MEYIKLGHVAERIAAGDFTLAQLLAGIAEPDATSNGDYVVVNVKGLILTATQVSSHLSGGVDGDTLLYNS